MTTRLLVPAAALVAVGATVVATALATPPSGSITRENLTAPPSVLGEVWNVNSGRLRFFNKERMNVLVQRVTYAPGADSGWHAHPGLVIVSVTGAGAEITRSVGCDTRVYRSGESFVENGEQPAGKIRNTGSVPAVLYATFVVPVEDPPTFSDPSSPEPSC